MAKRKAVRSVNYYGNMIEYYLEQRKKVRNGARHYKQLSAEQRSELLRLMVKIGNLRARMKKAELQEKKLRQIAAHVRRFFGITLYQIGPVETKAAKLVKPLFYKMALEAKIQVKRIATFIGLKTNRTVHQVRIRFTRSFKTKPENLQRWRDFSNFVNLNS